jgi:hypothetical protein
MRIRLIRKLALALNGVDVSNLHVGDVVDLPERSANILVAEGWAEPVSNATPGLIRTISPQAAS